MHTMCEQRAISFLVNKKSCVIHYTATNGIPKHLDLLDNKHFAAPVASIQMHKSLEKNDPFPRRSLFPLFFSRFHIFYMMLHGVKDTNTNTLYIFRHTYTL